MPTSHAEKAQAREYSTTHDCSYTTALRVIRDVADPLSFRSFLEETGADDWALRDVRDIVRRHPKFPGGRNLRAIRDYPPIYSLMGTPADVRDALTSYYFWLLSHGLIGGIIAAGGTGTVWESVAYDRGFPTGNDITVINDYLDRIDASAEYRSVVANRHLSQSRMLGFEVYAEGYPVQFIDLPGRGRTRVNLVSELPSFIRSPGFTQTHGYVTVKSREHVTGFHSNDEGRPTGEYRRAMLAGPEGDEQMYVSVTIEWTLHESVMDLEWVKALGRKAEAMKATLTD